MLIPGIKTSFMIEFNVDRGRHICWNSQGKKDRTLSKHVGIKHLYVMYFLNLFPYPRPPTARHSQESGLQIHWKKKTAATATNARTDVLACAKVAAAPVLVGLAEADVDETRAEVCVIDVVAAA